MATPTHERGARTTLRRALSGTLLAVAVLLGALLTTAAPAAADHHGIAPAPVTCAEQIRPVLRSGSTHSCVASLQHFLGSIAYISQDPALYPGPVDGHFGSRTGNAVARFQNLNRLNPDRVVGGQTWGAIAADCAVFWDLGAYNICHTQVRF